MRLLAFSGRKQSGKDTLGNFLVEKGMNLFGGGVKVTKLGWADPLKRMIGDLFQIPDNWLWGTDEDKNNLTSVIRGNLPHYVGGNNFDQVLTVRELMQQFGTEIIRKMNSDAWVNASMAKLDREKLDFVVFIDTRFPNEVNAIKDRGGKVIRLTRNEDSFSNHESELILDRENYDWSNFDIVLDNKCMTLKEQEIELVSSFRKLGWL